MKEAKEPEIKLFGRKIVLPDKGGDVYAGGCSGESGGGDDSLGASGGGGGGGVEARDDEEQLHAHHKVKFTTLTQSNKQMVFFSIEICVLSFFFFYLFIQI